MNPIEGLAWIYGKLFTDHQILGYLFACAIGALTMAILWTWGIDKYNERHQSNVGLTDEQLSISAITLAKNMRTIEAVYKKKKV